MSQLRDEIKDFLYKLSRTAYLLHHAVSDPVHNLESIKGILGDLKGKDPDNVPDSEDPWVIRAWVLNQIQDACYNLEMKIREEIK